MEACGGVPSPLDIPQESLLQTKTKIAAGAKIVRAEAHARKYDLEYMTEMEPAQPPADQVTTQNKNNFAVAHSTKLALTDNTTVNRQQASILNTRISTNSRSAYVHFVHPFMECLGFLLDHYWCYRWLLYYYYH